MSTKLREGDALEATRSTLGALNFSLRVSTKLRRERREGASLLPFWISKVARTGKRMEEEEGGHATKP